MRLSQSPTLCFMENLILFLLHLRILHGGERQCTYIPRATFLLSFFNSCLVAVLLSLSSIDQEDKNSTSIFYNHKKGKIHIVQIMAVQLSASNFRLNRRKPCLLKRHSSHFSLYHPEPHSLPFLFQNYLCTFLNTQIHTLTLFVSFEEISAFS